MNEADSFFIWLTTPPEGAMVATSHHRQQQRTKMRAVSPDPPQKLELSPKIFRNILDEDSINIDIPVPISSTTDEVDHQLHPSHLPTPQTLHEFDLKEVRPMTTSVLENALGGIQQSIQNLLEKGSGKENSNQSSKFKKFKHYPSPPESPISTTTKKPTLFSLVDGMQPTRMGPEFWKVKAIPQLLGDASRHERERMAVTMMSPTDSPRGNIRSVISNCHDDPNSSIEVAIVDFERFIDEMEARDDDATMDEMTSNKSIQSNSVLTVDGIIPPHFSARLCPHHTMTARTISPPPLQQQWLSDYSSNLHQSCRPSIRWLDEDILPLPRALDAIPASKYENDEERNE
jgi:hypothetical protein